MNGPDTPDTVSPAPPAPAAPRRRRWRRVLAGAAAVLLLFGAGVGWLVATESGLQALAATLPRASAGHLQVEAASGRLLGPLRIDRLRFSSPTFQLDIDALALDWRPAALFSGALAIDRLAADRIDVTLPAESTDDTPATAPDSLRLPLAVEAGSVELGAFRLRRGDQPLPVFEFSELHAALVSDRRTHRLSSLQARLPFGALTLKGEIDSASPFVLAAKATLAGSRGGHDYRVTAQAGGDLLAPRVIADFSGSALGGKAEIEAAPFAALPLRALRLQAGELDPAVFVAGAPTAALHVEATLASAATAAGGLRLVGPFSIRNARPATVDHGGLPLERLEGTLDWTAEAVAIDALVMQLGGGRAGGMLKWTPQAAGTGQLQGRLELAGIDTRRLDGRLPSQRIDGQIDTTADSGRQQARLALRAGAARIEADGERVVAGAEESSFKLAAKVRDLDPHALQPSAPRARIHLDLDAEGRLGAAQHIEARFRLPEGRFEGKPLRGQGRLRLDVAAAGARLQDVDIALDVAGNKLVARGAWGAARDRLAFDVDAPALAALGYGLGGALRAEGEASGGSAAPAGRFQLFASQLRLPGAVRIAGANASGRLEAGPRGALTLAAGLSGIGKVGEKDNWADALRLAVEGRADAHRIALSADELAGNRVQVELDGGWRSGGAATWQWSGSLRRVLSEGEFALRLLAPAALEVAPGRISLAAAEFATGEQGRVRLLETRWSPTASAFRGSLTGLTFGLVTRRDGRPRRGPGPLVLGAEWDVRLADTVDGELRLFREAGDLTVSGELPARLGLDAFEARLVARANRLSASVEARGSELGELAGSATAALARNADGGWQLAADAPLLGSARLAMPSIAWFGRLLRENVETGGRVEGEFTLAGTPAEPRASGRIRGQDLRLALVDQGLLLTGGELQADFDREQLRVERLAFVSPNRVRPAEGRIPLARLTATPGRLDASGRIALDSGTGEFQFVADRLPLLQRADRWLILSGRGEARSTWTTLALDAELRADAGYFEIAESQPPSLSDDVVILGREEAPGGGLAITSRIGVALGDALYLSALGVDTRLTGALQLRQTPGRPLAATGSVATVGGSYKGYGQRLAIERGLVSFQGPLDDPGLNIVALRKGLAVEAGVAITGSARRPQVRLVSEPSVPDPEKLSWIVLGRAPDAGSGADLALLLPAAQALLGGPGGGMTEQLSRSLGFDSFAIGQGELNSASRTATSRVAGSGTSIASTSTVAGQVLSVGKRLSTDLFLSFEQSLGGAESLVKLTYQLGRRVSVVARGGTDNALDLYYTFAFR